MSVTVVPSVTYFNPQTDNWHDPIIIDNQPWFIETANKSWSITNPDPHTIRVEVRAGDLWMDDGTSRAEILTANHVAENVVWNASYTMTVEPGTLNNPPLAWLSLAQMHEGTDIPFTIQLQGERMAVVVNMFSDY